MHIYGKDQQAFHLKRTEAERWWSRLNVIIVIVQLACFLSAIIRTGTNASNSMSNPFFAISPLQLKEPYLVPNCEYNVTRSHAFFSNVTYTMRPNNVGYFVSRGALNIRYLMAITAVHVAVSMLNRLWFETNTHELRYHFVVFRKDMITTWEVLLMVLGIVMTFSVTKENQIMTAYLAACSSSSNGSFYNSVQPYTELIVSYIVSIVITVINALFAIWNLSDENPREKMLKEDKKRQEEWQKAMREYYGLPEPTTNSGEGQSEGSGGAGAGGRTSSPQQQQMVTYGDNRATTAAVPPGRAMAPPGAPPQQEHHPHSHNYHHAIRKGLAKPFSSVSNALRWRSQQGDPVVAAQKQQHQHHGHQHPSAAAAGPGIAGPPQATSQPLTQQQLLQQQQQQQRYGNGYPAGEAPHVGPSVSRPLTPLLNEEYDDDEPGAHAAAAVEQEEDEMRQMLRAQAQPRGRSPVAPLDRRAHQPPPPQQQQVSSSYSGRYDLHEVDYDDEPYDSVDADITHSSPRGATSSSAPAAAHHSHTHFNPMNSGNGSGGGGVRPTPATAATPSDASSPLLNARLAAVPPPPPPGYSGDRRQRIQKAQRQMLAPPSPLQGAETTDDTVLQ